jgi:hypothetical protein
MAEPKEPQSYGSEESWVTGDVGQEVNRQKGHPNSQHADFYASHSEEGSGPDQGGRVSPQQANENARPAGPSIDDDETLPKKVAWAKTGSYFKKRDY